MNYDRFMRRLGDFLISVYRAMIFLHMANYFVSVVYLNFALIRRTVAMLMSVAII